MINNGQIIEEVLKELEEKCGIKPMLPNTKKGYFYHIDDIKTAIQKALLEHRKELEKIIDEELEIVKSRPTKGLPLLKLESIFTLTKLKQKLFKGG